MSNLSKLITAKHTRPILYLVFFGTLLGICVGSVGGLFQKCIAWMGLWRAETVQHLNSPLIKLGFSIGFSIVLLVIALVLVRRLAPETSGSGVQEIEGILEGSRQMRWKRVLPIKFIAGVCSLSSGGVLGCEGPTIQLGGALGKMMSQLFSLSEEFNHILIAAGAGAGLAVAFNAPLAGIIFVIEEMRKQFRFNFLSMQCVIVTCVFSDITLRIIMGQQAQIPMIHIPIAPLGSLWLFVVFGVLFGLLGVVFNYSLVKCLNFFTGLPKNTYWIAIVIVAAVIGALSYYYPPIIGGGYQVIPQALGGNLTFIALCFVFVLRLGSTWVSYGSGAPGGIFAPMLAIGTVFGMAYGHLAHLWFPNLITDPAMFAVAGMTALFTATVGAPLTGIVLVVEMTMNYSIILPLVLTCLSAAVITYLLGGHPIYETLLKRTLKLAKMRENLIKPTIGEPSK